MKYVEPIKREHFIHNFLKAEWYKGDYDEVRSIIDPTLLVSPNFDGGSQNTIREKLLYATRSSLLDRLPADTNWHIIRLSSEEFSSLFVIRESGWEQSFGQHAKVGGVSKQLLAGKRSDNPSTDKMHAIKASIGGHDFSDKLTLIATNVNGPYTIIDGNHRAIAFRLHADTTGDTSAIPSEFILGTSSSMGYSVWLNF